MTAVFARRTTLLLLKELAEHRNCLESQTVTDLLYRQAAVLQHLSGFAHQIVGYDLFGRFGYTLVRYPGKIAGRDAKPVGIESHVVRPLIVIGQMVHEGIVYVSRTKALAVPPYRIHNPAVHELVSVPDSIRHTVAHTQTRCNSR